MSYRYYRNIHTTAERRANIALEIDGREFGIGPRKARVGHNLPDAWDDILRGNVYDRSWKQFRRTQWRVR